LYWCEEFRGSGLDSMLGCDLVWKCGSTSDDMEFLGYTLFVNLRTHRLIIRSHV